MKIKQDRVEFQPISIVLETKLEAMAFIGLIDKVDHNLNSVPPRIFTSEEVAILTRISNAFTENEVTV